MTAARRSSLLAFGLSLLLASITAGAVDTDPRHTLAVPGDFNADGRLDMLFQPLKPGAHGAIVLQDGTGQLRVVAQDWDPGYLGLDWSTAASTLTTADLNGDGQDDVLIQPVKEGGTAAVVLTDPTVQLLQISQLLPAGYLGLDWSSATHAVIAGDFDGDHQKELLMLAAKRGGTGALVHADPTGHLVAVMQQFQDGFLGRHWSAQDENFYVGDFNGDGRQDLLVQSRMGGKGESYYALLLADGDGRFTHIAETWNLKDLGANWDPATHKIVIEDANHDGIMDITLRSTNGGTNYLFEGNAQGVIAQAAAHWTGNKSASDVVNKNTGTKPGTGISITVTPNGPTANTITPPSNPEQNQTTTTTGSGGAQGSGTIKTVNAAGTLEGSGGVSGGTATYSVPIVLPPGRAGMQPSVSLSYSSRGGNGNMGMGWSLAAGSQIHRCPATQAMDGYAIGVTYTSTDRLCLDGQHLILQSGTYGADGAVYRTELDSFVRVTEVGAITSSTSHFSVATKSGHTMGYGNTSGLAAVFTPPGAPAPLTWGLVLDLDTYNNSIIYNYGSFGSGEHLLTSIQYTGTGTTPGNREVDFTYSSRGDISNQYLGGGLTTQTQLLSTVITKYNGQTVRTYNADYSTSATTGRTLLAGMQECGGTGTSQQCLPETTFTWHAPANGFDAPAAMDTDKFCSGGSQDFNDLIYSFNSPGDLNGDGRRDLIMYRQDCGGRAYFAQAGGGFSAPVDIGSVYTTYLPPGQAASDLDGDGVAETIGQTSSGGWGYSRLNSTGDGFDTLVPLPGSASDIYIGAYDVNGDGLADILYEQVDPNHSNAHRLVAYINTTASCESCAHRTISFGTTPVVLYWAADNAGGASFSANYLGDMNGDGLPEFYLQTSIDPNATSGTWLFVQMDASGNLSFPTETVTGPVNKGYTIDLNGDGLPDKVYQCSTTNTDWCYVLNTGNMSSIYTAEVDTGVGDGIDGAPNKARGTLIADLNGDGIQELVYPGTLLADYCTIEHKGQDDFVTQCYNGGGSGPDLAPQDDLSIYQYSRIKFVWGPDSGGVYKYIPQTANTGIVAQNNTTVAMDVDGDGLTDFISAFSRMHTGDTFNNQTGFSGFTYGPQYVSNSAGSTTGHNAAPDLMTGATNGLGAVAQWNYYPLSSNKTYNGLDLYDAPAIGDADRKNAVNYNYFYFDSSMYVVGDYSTSDGVGGMRTHDFHYGPAIYSSQGRGFQGFRTVVDDDMTSGARTVQHYYQHFPLSGMLRESWVTTTSTAVDLIAPVPVANTYIDYTANTWGCMQGTGGSPLIVEAITCTQIMDAPTYVPVLLNTTVTKYDIASHGLLSTVDTDHCAVSSSQTCAGFGYDLYGNSLGTISKTTDADGIYTSTVSSSYPSADQDVTNWWVNKLKETTTTVQANYGTSTGAVVTRDTTFDYYADGTRGLNHSYAHADGVAANEIDTHYTYANGNVTSVSVSGGSGATAVAARTTTTTYSTGTDANYFPATVTDPMGLVAASTYNGSFGKPSSVTAPDGVSTTSTYDGFGRTISTQVGTLPAQTASYITHSSSDGMCDSTSAPSAYYVLTHQDGYPDHYACFDILNRNLRNVTESLVQGADLVYQGTDYNARGQVTGVTEPHYNNASAPIVWNYTTYATDILGRVTSKTDAKGVVTNYSYNQDTSLTGASPGYQQNETQVQTLADTNERDDLETRNSQGKLLTVKNVTNVSGQSTTTSYAYDSDGNPTTITADDGSVISASFDVLGHKASVSDPDQGATAYTYDVLGELLTQTDAKSQTLTMTYDSDGRMTTKESSVSGEIPVTWCYDGQTYLTSTSACSGSLVTVAKGKVSSVTQGDGSQYQENYSYDSYGRVSTDEEVIAGVSYDTDTAYDTDGRVDTVTYPDSITDNAPVVNAGGTVYALPSTDVTLHATVTDSDGGVDTAAYRWAQTAGTSVTLNNSTTTTPDFTTGAIGSSYTFQITADDGIVSASDSTTVTVPNLPGAPSGLTDTGDTDHDGTYTVSWGTVADTGTVITYHLEEATGTSSGATGTWTEIYAGTAASSSVSHPGNGSYYYWYRVRAEAKIGSGSLGYSGYSSQDSIHVVVTPGTPSSISPTLATSNTGIFTISWGAYTGSLPSSKVFYELDEAVNSSTFVGDVIIYSGTARSQSINTHSLGDFYFRVHACNQDGSLKECSDWEQKAHEIVNSTGGQQQVIHAPGGGTVSLPPPAGTTGMVIPALKPLTDDGLKPMLAIRSVKEGKGAKAHHAIRPNFAPPVYKAWADARMTNATGGGSTVRFAVKHIYSQTGYLWKLAEAANPNRIYWRVNESGGTSGNTDAAGEFYEHGMNAYGQVTDSYSASGAVTTHFGYDGSTDYLETIKSTDGGTNTYQDEQYTWATVGNLLHRTSNATATNTAVLQEGFLYDLHNRLTSSTVTNGSGAQTPVTYSYDSMGDIVTKSDVGTYTYGGTAGPHAVTSISGTVNGTYSYDANGNMTSRAGTTVAWNSDNLPTSMVQDANDSSTFTYAPDKHRYKEVSTIAGVSTTTIYAGGMQIITTGSTTTYEHTITAYGRSVVMEDLSNATGGGAQGKKSVLLTDHLGSVDSIVNATTTTLTAQGQSFDTFGKRRSATDWHTTGGTGSQQHGFTDHEQLDNIGLVHMNGRVYDPNVGRFLSVDPVFQAPTNGQSVNPYSYVMNNPLSLTDPSGYMTQSSGGADTAPLQAIVDPQGDQYVSLDFGSEGGVGGEGGRDSSGNLIPRDIKIADMQPGDTVVAGGYTFVKGADGSVTYYQGNGAADGATGTNSLSALTASGSAAQNTPSQSGNVNGLTVSWNDGGGCYRHSVNMGETPVGGITVYQQGHDSAETLTSDQLDALFPVNGGTARQRSEWKRDILRAAQTNRGSELFAKAVYAGKSIATNFNNREVDQAGAPGGPVDYDPDFTRYVRTTTNSEQPVSLMRAVVHELFGHAIDGTLDTGPGHLDNVRKNENPIMMEIAPQEGERTQY